MKNNLKKYKDYLIGIKQSLVYYDILNPFISYIEEKKINFSQISKDQLAKYFTEKKYKPQSINALIKACRNFCKYLNIKEHSCFEIKLLETERKLPNYITYEELLKGIKYYATYNVRGISTLKCNAVLKFMFFTGIRKSELLSLKRENIDLTNCSVKIWGQKDKTERLVYFPDTIIKELVDYFNSEEEKNNAFSITHTELYYLTKKISKHINKKISPHTLRHSSATYMMKKNVSPMIIQKILGHNSIQTTMIYANPDDKMIQEIYRKQIG